MKLFERAGPLTQELRLAPGGFGLGQVLERERPDATTTMTCGYCSTGCGLSVHLRNGAAVGLTPATEYPVNLGMACPKGWEALEVLKAPDRAAVPLLRNDRGQLEPINWPTALRVFVARFRAIQAEYGNDAVAFLSTGQIMTEEMALLGALAKFGMGMIHGDGNTRQCMATSVVAYKQSFGFDAPPYTYADLEESDVLVFVGSNLCVAHPILWQRVLRNPHRPEIIVVDPRKTETAMQATDHFAIRPKSDLALFYGLARLLIERDWIDRDWVAAHTNSYKEFAAFVAPFTIERVASDTGIDADRIERLAQTIHEGRRVSFWWTMGVNQSYEGTRTAQSLVNLALLTGNIGRPGTGANSITGQCNAMGSRLFSNTTSLFGGRDFENADDRTEVARILEIDERRIPDQNSWAYPEIISGILKGKIKGLWVIATNPAHSWINQSQLGEILDRLEFLVVQDMYHTTETARRADLVLPAAAWGEKDGTFINSERRYGLAKKVARAPGVALADFSIFKLVAEAWGVGPMFRRWESPAATFQILKHLSRGRPCDITGIRDYQMLDDLGGVQWPFTAEQERATDGGATADPATHRRLFADGLFYHPDGRARFIFENPRPMPEPPTSAYPLLLLTGRGTAAQWHTQTRTNKSAVLRKLSPRNPYVELNPTDARRLGIAQNEPVLVESQRGSIAARAYVTPVVAAGQVFIPMHYETVNQLTDAVFDPYSRQPSYKACAVRVRRASACPP
ncbi:MAG: nitrate reductase [Planctomycetia bacterium]|nr:nitrate reductase [Planctomycetia bacterium]